MSAKLFRGVVNDLPFRDITLCVPENVVTVLAHFVRGRRSGNVRLTMRAGEFDTVSIEETATVK